MTKLLCIDDKFSKPFKEYFCKDTVYSYIDSSIEESKYCSDTMKQHSNKELVITKKSFKNKKKILENFKNILRTLLNVRFVIILTMMLN